jgi:hypothetical protein
MRLSRVERGLNSRPTPAAESSESAGKVQRYKSSSTEKLAYAKVRRYATLSAVSKKPILKVTEWLDSVPSVAVCSFCGREFKVPVTELSKIKDTQVYLQTAFDTHLCSNTAAAH